MNQFSAYLQKHQAVLKKSSIDILQVNLGRLCNLTCSHCHVEAGPSKTADNMNEETVHDVIRALDVLKPDTVDLTGGAPEMNAGFRTLVIESVKRSCRVIDRSNLTILMEPGYEDLAEFLAKNRVEIIASLPCYSRENVDQQRGSGVFESSIAALRLLNSLGYGNGGSSSLKLNLVYNPVGPHLPPPEAGLEADYKTILAEEFGITFDRLYALTNMPITRYRKFLQAFNQLQDYENLLRQSFNPATLDSVMCLNTLSVGWDGFLYDCDFNQMLEMKLGESVPLHIREITKDMLQDREIRTGEHCFACTAGAGSSCQGAVVT